MAAGIEVRHARDCRTYEGGKCNCRPTYRGRVWDNRASRRVRRSFPTRAAAEAWYHDAKVALRSGALPVPSPVKLAETAERWLDGARAGTIRNRGGTPYKPSVLRGYERCLRLRVLPALGHLRLAELQRRDVQDFADQMLADGVDAATVVKTLDPLRAICRRAVRHDELAVNPTEGLELPRASRRRERVAPPAEAAALIAAAPKPDRAVVGDRVLRRPAPRRAARPARLGRRREHHPGVAQLGR